MQGHDAFLSACILVDLKEIQENTLSLIGWPACWKELPTELRLLGCPTVIKY